MFVFGFLVLAVAGVGAAQSRRAKALGPTTVFNTAFSFVTNTNLQHYAGEQHLSYFSQIFAIIWQHVRLGRRWASAPDGGDPRAARRSHMGNYYVDMWRVVDVRVPAEQLDHGRAAHGGGRADDASTASAEGRRRWKGSAAADRPRSGGGADADQAPGHQRRRLLRRQLGPPFENPNAWTNYPGVHELPDLSRSSLVVMFGRMLKNMRHATVIYGVMMLHVRRP